jgi:hypothetical protein
MCDISTLIVSRSTARGATGWSDHSTGETRVQFGNRGTVEIAALIGDYLMITTVYNALGMRLRSDQEATLPHRAGAPVGAEWR